MDAKESKMANIKIQTLSFSKTIKRLKKDGM
jgi:hypothetical protein